MYAFSSKKIQGIFLIYIPYIWTNRFQRFLSREVSTFPENNGGIHFDQSKEIFINSGDPNQSVKDDRKSNRKRVKALFPFSRKLVDYTHEFKFAPFRSKSVVSSFVNHIFPIKVLKSKLNPMNKYIYYTKKYLIKFKNYFDIC